MILERELRAKSIAYGDVFRKRQDCKNHIKSIGSVTKSNVKMSLECWYNKLKYDAMTNSVQPS